MYLLLHSMLAVPNICLEVEPAMAIHNVFLCCAWSRREDVLTSNFVLASFSPKIVITSGPKEPSPMLSFSKIAALCYHCYITSCLWNWSLKSYSCHDLACWETIVQRVYILGGDWGKILPLQFRDLSYRNVVRIKKREGEPYLWCWASERKSRIKNYRESFSDLCVM